MFWPPLLFAVLPDWRFCNRHHDGRLHNVPFRSASANLQRRAWALPGGPAAHEKIRLDVELRRPCAVAF